jgi:hypothetical protein
MAASKRLIDRLKEAEGWNVRQRYPYEIKDANGEVIETVYFRPRTRAVRKKVQALSPKDAAEYTTQMLIQSAELEDGSKAFELGDFDVLQREISEAQLDEIELFMINAGATATVEDEKKDSEATLTPDLNTN